MVSATVSSPKPTIWSVTCARTPKRSRSHVTPVTSNMEDRTYAQFCGQETSNDLTSSRDSLLRHQAAHHDGGRGGRIATEGSCPRQSALSVPSETYSGGLSTHSPCDAFDMIRKSPHNTGRQLLSRRATRLRSPFLLLAHLFFSGMPRSSFRLTISGLSRLLHSHLAFWNHPRPTCND